MKKKAKKAKIADLPVGVGVGRNSNGTKDYWKVRLGKKFTGGKVITRNFETLAAAREWLSEDAPQLAVPKIDIKTLKEQSGTQAFSLPHKQLAEALDALRRCKEAGIELSSAIDFAIKFNKPKAGKITITDAIPKLIEFKKSKDKRPTYLEKLEAKLKRFARYFPAKTTLNEITTDSVENYLASLDQSPAGQIIEARHISVLFGWAVKKGYTPENPVRGVERPHVHRKPPVIMRPEQALALLNTAEELTPWVAVGLFAGLRPEEAKRLAWEDIDFDARHIDLPAIKAKGRTRRIVPFLGEIEKWIDPFRQESGPIVPPNFRRRFWAMTERAGYRASNSKKASALSHKGWPKDVLRHCFGSYHLAKWASPGQTAEFMGHRNSQMLYQHYREVIKHKADIESFWALKPSDPENGKVIREKFKNQAA
ncbi:MAG: hypothetical protein FGM15_04830 [Chthoniobacterales bacterium]|nr:hypothetical protein [Chthoniobacterales bacterium]